ncbi:conserved hypothetical protein [Bathymodiolus platifrons methanotrophic gill symbiont]|uniref:hypothetical protein n=1 Tax=Bathymodiolus platifrons methanotrophic gill symbiont TaxID=113268 RepID=UPI000B416A49|nr:hypothetical protein [Bathymodiolus platifrons methanotrophic gill symbiont]TXK94707.1 hypothetical protein BMR10_12360 [Methylococcaceae bacterium CS4]TXK97896.1 hypothetical protein BMR11_09290 [Methylococcaceae bacterium CS5]TXL06795.1 hypothetical protein BMR07_06385 [Methylococcaceae bacterium CS1]TXL08678.1 hypothetical protein BMR09_02305 [Methylococcaceae bacterium CS3]TXL12323.1 hypothetical protein BMR08_00670 [Methylococcaceae bacterium CS2]TXL13328.1 hypothetical protein BMR05_
MSDTLSSNAIIYAILSLNSEVALQKEFLDSPDVLPEDRENEEGILDDLEQAFMEFVDFYKSCRKQDSSLPELDELLNNPL